MSTVIIYLIGHPGVGKYTIARELEKHGFVVCDNQLINNPIFELLQYNGIGDISQIGWDAIAKIRTVVFDFIAMEKSRNYVLTNCLYENEGDRQCYSQVQAMAQKRGSLFVPVQLQVAEQEHMRRITHPARKERWKSVDPQEVYKKGPLISLDHPYLLELDVTELSPSGVVEKILKWVDAKRN